MIRFGTDGVRGRAGVFPIDAPGAARIGQAALRWARSVGDGRVLIARDTRPSGAELARAAGEAIVAAGGVWLDAGVLSSPGLAAAIHGDIAPVGIMVTASHNAAPDNGFKLVGPGGHKPDDAATAQLLADVAPADHSHLRHEPPR